MIRSQVMGSDPASRFRGWGSWAIFVTAWVAFLPSLDNQFVNLDDHENFVFNHDYRGVGRAQLAWAWRTCLIGVYQPLAWMLLGLEHAATGMRPWGYHATSIALHSINAVLLYRLIAALLTRASGSSWGESAPGRLAGIEAASWLAAAAFAVHPLRVEVVAWISCQPYLPCAGFMMLSILAYLKAHPAGRPASRLWLLASFFAASAAMLSKAIAVSLPFLLMIVDAYPLRMFEGPRPGRGRRVVAALLGKVPFLLLSLTFIFLALWARLQNDSVRGIGEFGFGFRARHVAYSLVYYLVKTVSPLALSAYHPTSELIDLEVARWAGCFLALLALAASVSAAIAWRRPGIAAAVAAYVGILAPNMGFFQVSNQVVSDRYSYVATMSLYALAAAALAPLLVAARSRSRVVASGLGLLTGLGALTWAQCGTWRNSETLWAHAVASGGGRQAEFDNAELNNFLGRVLMEHRRPAAAVDYFERARDINLAIVASNPTNLKIRLHVGAVENNLGNALGELGRTEEAMEAYRRAIEQQEYILQWQPIEPVATEFLGNHYFNRGHGLAGLGRTAEALADFERSRDCRAEILRQRPYRSDAREAMVAVEFRIALACADLGLRDVSVKSYAQARLLCEGLVASYPDVQPYRRQLRSIDERLRALKDPGDAR